MGQTLFILGGAILFFLLWMGYPWWEKMTTKTFDELRSKHIGRH